VADESACRGGEGPSEQTYLSSDLLLLVLREGAVRVVLCADEEGDRRLRTHGQQVSVTERRDSTARTRTTHLVEAPRLAVPLLYRVERALARQVKHEEDGDGVVADERQHRDELALAAEIPDRERDLGVADRDLCNGEHQLLEHREQERKGKARTVFSMKLTPVAEEGGKHQLRLEGERHVRGEDGPSVWM